MAQQTDYSGIGSVIKWSAIGVGITAVVLGGSYVLITKVVNNKKQDKAYSSSIGVDANGRSLTTVGNGKTPSAYASLINAALLATIWGVPNTDEDAVYKNLRELSTQFEVALVSKAYEALYKKTLNEALQNDLDDDEFAIAVNIISSKPTGAKK